ncbi:MAG TPA: hypothetical protein VNA24_16640 [Hyalangium sp.]|nr:hypothetical protein [Hyalangium sp.]
MHDHGASTGHRPGADPAARNHGRASAEAYQIVESLIRHAQGRALPPFSM